MSIYLDNFDNHLEPPCPFEDVGALDELRRNVFESVGFPWAVGILYGIGMARGLTDGLRATQSFGVGLSSQPALAGAGIPMIFTPERGRLPRHIAGSLRHCMEARVHARSYPQTHDPICFISAGYAAGWYSALLDGFYLVRETSCSAQASGPSNHACHFAAEPASALLARGDVWATELLPYRDYEQLRGAALEQLGECGEGEDGDMLGAFDAMSPAVHVWGPVMVLPFSGARDSSAAVRAILEDVGNGQIRAAVVDLTGVRTDAGQASGLLHLIDELEACGLETVVVGLRPADQRAWLDQQQSLSLPLSAADITGGIALAFQLCRRYPV